MLSMKMVTFFKSVSSPKINLLWFSDVFSGNNYFFMPKGSFFGVFRHFFMEGFFFCQKTRFHFYEIFQLHDDCYFEPLRGTLK